MSLADAIVFDFDGVISDSEPVHERALRAAAEAVGMRFASADFSARFVGLGDVSAFKMIAEDHGRALDDDELAALCAHKLRAFVTEERKTPPRPVAGSIELIHASAARVPVGVCTGSRRAEVGPMLERFGVRGLLRAFVTADDVEHPKPDPAGYRLAAEKLGGGRVVAIEDSPTGIAAAKGAGLRVLAVCQSYPADRLKDADRIVERITDLDVDMILRI